MPPSLRITYVVPIVTSTPIELELVASRRPSLGQSLRELWAFGGTILAFAVRDIRVKYEQAVLGVAWAPSCRGLPGAPGTAFPRGPACPRELRVFGRPKTTDQRKPLGAIKRFDG